MAMVKHQRICRVFFSGSSRHGVTFSTNPTNKIPMLDTIGVNQSIKISDLRKCINPIRTSVVQPIFSWTWTGHWQQQTSRIFRRHRFMARNSVIDTAICVSLIKMVTFREHLPSKEQFINIIGNANYLTIFGHQNISSIFRLYFWLALDVGLDRI